MTPLFHSFEYLNRSRDERVLETQSVRAVFTWLVVTVFMLGAMSVMTIYEAVRLHRIDWTGIFLIVMFGGMALQNGSLIYRHLTASHDDIARK